MEDLSRQISQILSDPQSMQQIQGLLGSLGMAGRGTEEPSSSQPAQEVPAAQQAPVPSRDPPASPEGLTPELLGMMTRLAPLLSRVNREDDTVRLLRALRPLLSEARQSKVDEALKLLQVMRLLPLLRESGVFSGLLSGLL